MKNINYKYVNTLLILLIIYVLFLLRGLWFGVFFKILAVLRPFIIAFIIAYAIFPFKKWLEKKKFPKVLSILTIITLTIFIIIVLLYSLIPIFTDQLVSFFSSIITFLSDIGDKFNLNIEPVKKSLFDIFNKISLQLGQHISSGAITIVSSSISFISNFLIVFVSFIYFLIDMEHIRDNIGDFFAKKGRRTYKLIRNIDYEITQYFKGLSLTMVIQFFEYTFLFYIIGHPNFLLLGVLTAIASLMPYFGGFIVNTIAIIIASVISPKLLIMTLIVAIIFPNIDGYVINPRIYGKTNNISPILTIFAVFAGGVLGGVVGILIALPTIIILKTLYSHYKNDISKKIINIKDKI